MVDRQAVDQERADAHVLEAPRRAPEEVALGRAPVLAEDAADAVAAAAEREPDRQAELEEELDGLEGLRLADQRQRLEQHEVRRVLGEHAGEQLDGRAPVRRVHLLGDRERDGAVVAAAALVDRAAREPHAEPRDVHPVHDLARAAADPQVEPGRREDRPRVGREHVTARVDVAPVHVEHGLRRPEERPRAPQLRLGDGRARVPLQLGGDAAVEHDAALVGDHRLEPPVRGRRFAPAPQRGPGRRHQRFAPRTRSGCASTWVICLKCPKRASISASVRRCSRSLPNASIEYDASTEP